MPHHWSDRIAALIDSKLHKLMPPLAAQRATPSHSIDEAVRACIRQHIETLENELASDGAIVAAWRDLRRTAENVTRTVEEIGFRRDTLYSIAERRNLDVTGSFGLFADVCRVLTDVSDAVQEELDREAGIPHEPTFSPPGTPSKVETWRRAELCENVLSRPPERGNCIVWFRVAPANLPQWEITHGQITLYNAAYLSGFIGHPELAHRFSVPPTEALTPPASGYEPIVREGDEAEWPNDNNMVMARVSLPAIEIHAAEAEARALLKGLIAVNHAVPDTWKVLKGSKLYIDGQSWSFFPWQGDDDVPEMYFAQNDRTGRDIEVMTLSNRSVDPQTIHDLQDAINMSTLLKTAVIEGPQAVVMAAVRAIEHVNAWATGGDIDWDRFASRTFKKSYSRINLIGLMDYYTLVSLRCGADLRNDTNAQQELHEIERKMKQFIWPHERYDRRVAANRVADLHRMFRDHWLSRGLGELESVLAAPENMHARLEEQGHRFDRQLHRLKRLRNAAIHAGPVSDAACQSVGGFAFKLGHQCLNTAMAALLTGRDIPSYIDEHRTDERERHDRIRASGQTDDLFLPDVEQHDDD